MYRRGKGVPKDDAEAVKWTRKAAEQDDAQAQFRLATDYALGRGVETNVVESVKWFRAAAQLGYVPAQEALADAYIAGKGVVKDLIEAYKWSAIAAGYARFGRATTKQLDNLAKEMTEEQVAEAKARANSFVPRRSSPLRKAAFEQPLR